MLDKIVEWVISKLNVWKKKEKEEVVELEEVVVEPKFKYHHLV